MSNQPDLVPRSPSSSVPRAWIVVGGVIVLGVLVALGVALRRGAKSTGRTDVATAAGGQPSSPAAALPDRPLVFTKDIAPLIFHSCVPCHRPGQAAPFPFLNYEQVRKHAKQIVEVTRRRYMPPWLPERGYGEFVGDRSLTDLQITMLRRWVDEGAVEGDSRDLPPVPQFNEGWQLGQPDLIITLPQPYNLVAEGKDVYRDLVVPIPLPANRFVSGVEFIPGNPRVIHHAWIFMDETGKSRRIAERQNPPGIDGMEIPDSAVMPSGQLTWQPGRVPYFAPPGLSWALRTNTDLLLQLHMHPSGKPETVMPAIGFHFTDQPPTNAASRIGIKDYKLDIPPGESNYTTEVSYTLPVDVTFVRVSTHAHFLAKEMQGFAILPTGEKKWLIWIKNWDFNWQGDYEYTHPQFVPKGSQIFLHYTYDNSTNNVRNPSNPPKRVRFGPQTTDEMCELWLHTLTATPEETRLLARDYYKWLGGVTMDFDRFRLTLDPDDAAAHTRLGHDCLALGRIEEARNHILAALRVQPDHPRARFELALIYLTINRSDLAEPELRAAIRLDPYNSEAWGRLGGIYLQAKRLPEAREAFASALRINPDDAIARRFLDMLSRP